MTTYAIYDVDLLPEGKY